MVVGDAVPQWEGEREMDLGVIRRILLEGSANTREKLVSQKRVLDKVRKRVELSPRGASCTVLLLTS